MSPQIARVVVRISAAVVERIQTNASGAHGPRDRLRDVLYRRHIAVIVLQRVVSVRIRRYDPLRAGPPNRLRVVVPQGGRQQLLAVAADIVPAILLSRSENPEVLPSAVEDGGSRAPDLLDAVVIRGDAVDKIQRLGLAT